VTGTKQNIHNLLPISPRQNLAEHYGFTQHYVFIL
jgi:hypothetical protein